MDIEKIKVGDAIHDIRDAGALREIAGKGLSTNDYTNEDKSKLEGIEADAQKNKIESIKVNGSDVTPDPNKAVNVSVPTKMSDLNLDGGDMASGASLRFKNASSSMVIQPFGIVKESNEQSHVISFPDKQGTVALTSDIPDVSGKQDTIQDLETIRSGAAKGETSVQPLDIEDMVKAEPIGSIIPPVNPSQFATKEEVSQLAQEVDLKIEGVATIDKGIVWSNGYVNGSTGKVTESSTSQFSQPVLLKAGEKLSYKTGAAYTKAVVKVDDSSPVAVGDTLSGDTIINYGTANVAVEYTATEDIYIVITVQISSNEIIFTEYNSNSIQSRINVIDAKVSGLENRAGGLPLMELGNISASGTDISNSSYARTIGYIQGPFSIKLASGLIFGNVCKFRKDGDTYTKIGNPTVGTSLYIATNDEYYYRFAVSYNGQTVSNPQDVIESANLKDVLNDANIKGMAENTKEIVNLSAPFSSSTISGGTLSDGRMARISLIGAILSTNASKYTEMIPIVRGKEYQVKTYIHLMYDAGVAYYKTNTISPENFCGLDKSFVGDGSTNQAVTKTGKLEIPANANYFVVFSRDASVMEITELTPVASAENSALDGKVDKIAGKGLSTNDFSNDDKAKLDSLQPGGVPEEVVREAVNDYVEENSGGFIAQPNGLNLVTSNTYKLMPSVLGEPIALTAGWTGDLSNGFTHTSGNTNALEFSLSGYATGDKLLVTFDATGISSESADVLISHGTSVGIKSYNGGTSFVAGFINDGTNLFVTPMSGFSGTITNLKVRKIDEDNGTETVTVSEDNLYTYRGNLVAGYWNIAIGSRYDVLSKLQDGTRNIAIGKMAMNDMVIGNRNVAIGTFSMAFIKDGENNVSIGSDTTYPATKANYCVAIGKGVLSGKTVDGCVAIGPGAMGAWNNTWERSGCVAIGRGAGPAIISECTHIGMRAGANVSGEKNTSVGYNALGIGTRSTVDIVGTKLTCIGYNASVANNVTAKEATNSTAIGANATITGSNQMVLGDSNVAEFILGGKRLVFNNDNTVSWETIS